MSCWLLLVGSVFSGHRARAKRRDFRAAARESWRRISVVRAPLAWRQGGAECDIPVEIYYILCRTCVLNTKHSRSMGRVQALFYSTASGLENRRKNSPLRRFANDHHLCPPGIHRFVHSAAGYSSPDERTLRTLQFYDTRHRGRRVLAEREQRAAGDGDDRLARARRTIGKAGEAPERRQDRAPRAEDEAGQSRRLLAAAVNAHARMHVPAQRVARGRRRRLVAREERRQRVRARRRSRRPSPPAGRRRARRDCRGRARSSIVACALRHATNASSSAATRPARACRKSPSTTRRASRRALDQRGQPREVGGGRAARQRHAARAKRRGLAEMNVGDEQRALARPVQRALGVQRDALAADDGVEHAVGRRDAVAGASKPRREGHGDAVELRCDCAAARATAHNRSETL